MPSTYTIISSNTLSTTATSVTFSAIPNTFTDLVILVSSRGNGVQTPNINLLNINGNATSNFSSTYLRGFTSTVNSARDTASASTYASNDQWSASTSNVFSSTEIYIPNYLSTTGDAISSFTVTENNSSTAYMAILALYSSLTAAVTSLTVSQGFGNSFVAGSSFYLYGISKS